MFKLPSCALACVLAFSGAAFAQQDFLDEQIKDADAKALAFGNDDLQRLQEYRRDVEDHAYLTTLKLCEGYRRARGLGPAAFHGGYVFSLPDSVAAWAGVIGQGLYQPISAAVGDKAAYLRLTHTQTLAFDSWFRSLYALYLIHSWGFLQGAVHCLDTLDQGQINMFAAAITAVDYESSLATDVAVVVVSDGVFSAIAKATPWIWTWWPARYLQNVMSARLGQTKIVFGAALTLPILVADLFNYIGKISAGESTPTRTMATGDSPRQLILTAEAMFYRDYANRDSDYRDLTVWVRAHIDGDAREQAARDLDALRAMQTNGTLSTEDAVYLAALEVMVPIVAQIPP